LLIAYKYAESVVTSFSAVCFMYTLTFVDIPTERVKRPPTDLVAANTEIMQ